MSLWGRKDPEREVPAYSEQDAGVGASFDDLARSLATQQLSRGQVLKGVLAAGLFSMVGPLTPWRTPSAAAQACDPSAYGCTPDPIAANNVCGNCEEFDRYLHSTGVVNSAGDPHPCKMGITEYEYHVAGSKISETFKPVRGKWCLSATINFTASVANSVFTLRWSPPIVGERTEECAQAISRWCARVDQHEQHHVDINNNLVAEFNAGTATFANGFKPEYTKTFTSCVKKKSDRQIAENQITSDANAYAERLQAELVEESAKRNAEIEEPNPPPFDSCCCAMTQTWCGALCSDPLTAGTCVNLQTDPKNCGSCGNICTGGRTCQEGRCQCPSGRTSCGGQCVDTQTNTDHCGSCGNACASGEICQGGRCQCTSLSCPSPQYCYEGQCRTPVQCGSVLCAEPPGTCCRGSGPFAGLGLCCGPGSACRHTPDGHPFCGPP
jgi:hypothetical protein